MTRSIHDKIEHYLRLYLSVADVLIEADREHREMLQVCQEKDAEKTAGLMKAPVMDVCRDFYSHLFLKMVLTSLPVSWQGLLCFPAGESTSLVSHSTVPVFTGGGILVPPILSLVTGKLRH